MTPDEKKEAQRLTVLLLLEVRREMLSAGANPLKHWDQLQDRLLIASRTTATLHGWFAALCKHLCLPAVDSSTSLALDALQHQAAQFERQWVAEIQRLAPALIAQCRVVADAKKEARMSSRKEAALKAQEPTT